MDTVVFLLPAIVVVAVIVALFVLAERSIKRQRGSLMRRGSKEQIAAGRVVEKHSRWAGGGGGGA